MPKIALYKKINLNVGVLNVERNFCVQAVNSELTVGGSFILKDLLVTVNLTCSNLYYDRHWFSKQLSRLNSVWSFNVANTQVTPSRIHQEWKRPAIFLDVISSSPSSCGRSSGHVPASGVLITSHLCLRNTRNENKLVSIVFSTWSFSPSLNEIKIDTATL